MRPLLFLAAAFARLFEGHGALSTLPRRLGSVEACSAADGALLLEFNVEEAGHLIACTGHLELQVRTGAKELLGRYRVDVDSEHYGEDVLGRPRFSARFPIAATGAEWLEAQFILTLDSDRPALVARVAFRRVA
jgi:hypothetical protein